VTKTKDVFFNEDMEELAEFTNGDYSLAGITCKNRNNDHNEDSFGIFKPSKSVTVIAVADGAGGHNNGEEASKTTIIELQKILSNTREKNSYRSEILDAFDRANDVIIEKLNGAATTLLVVELHSDWFKYYCAGDSAVEVVGGKGKQKFRSVGHSSFDMVLEAGVDMSEVEDEADLRNTITNCVGSTSMRVEVGPKFTLDPRDVIVVGSDGLFDNVDLNTYVNTISRSNVKSVCKDLLDRSLEKMYKPDNNDGYSKPDDVTIVTIKKI